MTYPCYVQPKLNGIRALYQGGFFQSRDEIPWKPAVLAHLSEPLKKVFGPDVILDGELYVHGWPLQRINAAVTPVRNEPTEDTLKVEFHVFDIVKFDTRFQERFVDLGLFLEQEFRQIKTVETWLANNVTFSDDLYSSFVTDGYEGMMYRLGDCPYTLPKQHWAEPGRLWNVGHKPRSNFISDKDNRCWHLLKRKDWHDDEFECIEVQEGEGKYKGMLGALVCKKTASPFGLLHNKPTFSVGSGLTDTERHHFWKNPPIGQQIKVKYLVLSSDGIPLNPTILCINPK